MYLAALDELGGHDDDLGVLLQHHAPHVADRVLETALRGDVVTLRLRMTY